MAVKAALSDFRDYTGMISNSGHDERHKYSGGKAGDQNSEWVIRTWYSRPWNIVIRFQDSEIAAMLATLSIYAAKNAKVGYDQGQRTSYWTQLKAAGYDPRKINTACEADCSAGVLANTKAALYLTGHKSWGDRVSIYGYTGNMRSIICGCGAKVKVFSDYSHTHSKDYLLPGDILLNTSAHTAVNLGVGKKMEAPKVSGSITAEKKTYSGTFPTLPKKGYFCKGDTGTQVKHLQKFLRWYGTYTDAIDGSFGKNTELAVAHFQNKEKLVVDLWFGPKCLARAKKVKK